MRRIAITGGSGFIGRELTRQLYDSAERIVIYSRSESKQAEMKQRFPEYPDNKMRYFIGDVRDRRRLTQAFKGIDCVIHAAALKRVEVAEYDPMEAIKTNIIGTMNVIEACNDTGVMKCITTSSDKAVSPITNYGGTKLCGERLFIGGNNLGACRFSICRYANVIGSTGSVIPLWEEQYDLGDPLTVTDKRMTRMWIGQGDAARFVLHMLKKMNGGEIFIPDLIGKKMTDLANEISPNCEIKEIGMRPNEKLHEALISESEARDCYKSDGYYTIYPAHHDWTTGYSKTGVKVPENFTLTSEI